MPSVFVSYATADRAIAEQLSALLAAQEMDGQKISVWRDQEKLYGGQKWPKALGEAIAGQDYVLLLWSQRAAQSHFVEFEWNTAIALKKTIIPCQLDAAPLPPSLTADQGIVVEEPEMALPKIVAALQGQPAPRDPARTSAVVGQLAGIGTTKDKDVAREAKSIFAKQHWNVQGTVYQAAGDINIIAPSSPKQDKSLLEKWQTWVALAVGILTIVTLALELPRKIPWLTPMNGSLTDAHGILNQPLAGQVVDASNGYPLSGVRIAVLDMNIEPQVTDQDGHFRFDGIRGKRQERVQFTVTKECYKVDTHEANLGNTDLRPALEKADEEHCR
jgi:hypothetical protein